MYLSNMSKALILSMGVAASLSGVSAAAATVLVSNLAQPTRDMNVLPTDGWAAQSFITDGASYSLSSVQVLLGNLLGSPPIVAELHTGDAFKPGATLTTFSVAKVPVGSPEPVNLTLTPIGSVTLDAGTNYWLVLGASSLAGTFTWSYAEGNVTTGPGFLGGYNYSADSGATWTNFGSDNPFQLQVNASPVPLPAPVWLFGTGLLTLLGASKRRPTSLA